MHPSRRNYATIKCSFDNNEDDLDSQVLSEEDNFYKLASLFPAPKLFVGSLGVPLHALIQKNI